MADLKLRPSHILLMDVMNARYPIDVNVIHKITQSHGRILRILIQRDQQQAPANSIRALVEFDSIDSAVKARTALNGADIYSGCCTLNIDFFHAGKTLNVGPRNTADMCDFSRQGLLDSGGGGGGGGGSDDQPGGNYQQQQQQRSAPYGGGGAPAATGGAYSAYGSSSRANETAPGGSSMPPTATAAAIAGASQGAPGAYGGAAAAAAADPYGQQQYRRTGRGSPPPTSQPPYDRYPPAGGGGGAPPYAADPYGRPPYGAAPPYAGAAGGGGGGGYPPRQQGGGYDARNPYAPVDPYGRDTLPPPQSNWPPPRSGGRPGGRDDYGGGGGGGETDYYGGRRDPYSPGGGPHRGYGDYGGPPPHSAGRPYPPRGGDDYGERNGERGGRGRGRGGGGGDGDRGGRGGRGRGGFDRGGGRGGGGGRRHDDEYGRGGSYGGGGGMPPHSGYYPPPVPPGYHHHGGGGGGRGEDNLGEIPVFYPPSLDGGDGCILIIYGLAERFTCDTVFNLFSLYGNVIKIKFMKSKDGACMIQMSDSESSRRCIACLNRVRCFEQQIEVCYSKQSFLHDVRDPFTLPNGTQSFKDFSSSKLNRYMTPDTASKNRITPPSRCLHFYNAPPYYTESELMEIFEQKKCPLPSICTIINPRSEESKSGKPISGFVEWESLEGSVEAVVLANHHELPNIENPVHGFPYCFKLCFTQPSRRLQQQQQQGGGGRGGGGSGGGGGRSFGSGYGHRPLRGGGRGGSRGGGGGNRHYDDEHHDDNSHESANGNGGENFINSDGHSGGGYVVAEPSNAGEAPQINGSEQDAAENKVVAAAAPPAVAAAEPTQEEPQQLNSIPLS